MSIRNPAIDGELPETDIGWEISTDGEYRGSPVLEVEFEEDLYGNDTGLHESLLEAVPDSMTVMYDGDSAYVKPEAEQEDLSSDIIEYLEEVDQELARERGMEVREDRIDAAIDLAIEEERQGRNSRFHEELPYSDLGVDVLYQGEDPVDEEGAYLFRYDFDDFMYDDYADQEALTVNDRTKQVLENLGPEEVDMEFQNMTTADVTVNADTTGEAVQIVYDHLENIDQEQASIQPGVSSRSELQDEISSMLMQEELIVNR
jgi:hypothetical protein